MKLPYQKLIHPQYRPITKFTIKSTLPDPLEDLKYYFHITLSFLKWIFYITLLGTWYSSVTRVHMEVLSHALCMFFCCSGHFLYCIILFLEGEPPPPRSTPWGAYRSMSHVRQYLFLSFNPSTQHFLLLHSFLVDRSMVVGHVLKDHTCSFMCTSHIDMTAHNPAFLQVG